MPNSSTKLLNIALWIVQGLLAASFLMAGYVKFTDTMEDLTLQMGWPAAVPEPLVRFIGFTEMAGALGLLVPALTKIKTVLTPWAATGLVVIMVMAAIFHLMRGEYPAIGVNLGFAALAAFVAWGRFRKVIIEEKKR